MARGAASRNARVVKLRSDRKADRARVTHFARSDSRNVVRRFTGRRPAVVAGGAAIGDASVIKLGRENKACRARVAHLARSNGRNVVCRLSDSNRAVVAGCTGRGGRNVRVINAANIAPHGRLMARLALLIRRHMVLRFARYRLTIVTIET